MPDLPCQMHYLFSEVSGYFESTSVVAFDVFSFQLLVTKIYSGITSISE